MTLRKCFLAFLTIVLLLSFYASGFADTAADLTVQCRYCSTDKEERAKVLTDDNYMTYVTLEADGYIQVDLPDQAECGGLYIQFRDIPVPYTVQAQRADQGWEVIAAPDPTIVNMFVPLLGRFSALRVVVTQQTLIAELRVFGAGPPPDRVQRWEHMQGKADLMLVVAHPDDELVFLGGTLPYYCGQLHKKAVVVYMTTGWDRRRNELLDGLWACGVHDYPVLCEFPDGWSTYKNYAYKIWGGRDFVNQKITGLIRKYQPDVVVSQDIINGETKHGLHLAVAESTVQAVQLAADNTYDTESLNTFGLWQVKKLYLHLYRENRIIIPWDTMELSEFGGKTAARVAQEAFNLHISQQETHHKVYLSGNYDSRKFGLYFSTVGADAASDDFFENISD